MSQQVALSLRYLRRRAGFSQEELAKRIGVNRVSVIRWEMGVHRPNLDTYDALSEALGVSHAVLLDAIRGGSAA